MQSRAARNRPSTLREEMDVLAPNTVNLPGMETPGGSPKQVKKAFDRSASNSKRPTTHAHRHRPPARDEAP